MVFLFITFGFYFGLTSTRQIVIWDIHPTIVAAGAVLRNVDPYAPEVTLQIQEDVYGRPALPGEDVQGFAYPIYVAFLGLPLALMPLPWAQAIWLSLLLTSAIAGVALTISLWNWPCRLVSRVLVVMWSLAFYGVVWGFVLGQIALIIFALLATLAWAAHRRFDGLAGVMVGFMIIKPQTAFLIVPAVLGYAAVRRRWRLVVSALVIMLILVGVPTIFHLNWISGFVRRLGEYNIYSPFTAPVVVVAKQCCEPVAGLLAPIAVILIVGAMLYGWRVAVLSGNEGDFLWAFGATLIATTLIAPQISTINQIILLVPIMAVFKRLASKGVFGIVTLVFLLVLWGAVPWLLSLVPPISTAHPRHPVEHKALSPIIPFTLGALWIGLLPALRLTRSNHDRVV
jgi:hypothetical protein